MINKLNTFHLVSLRPWPILSSNQIYRVITTIVFSLSIKPNKYINIILTLTLLINPIIWWKNIIKETVKEGIHLKKTQKRIKIGIMLFILSEILFFFSFFWSYFHRIIRPNTEIGQIWPPIKIKAFNPVNVPLLNTIILIRSGFSITWSHHEILKNNLKKCKKSILITLALGAYFTTLQAIEYKQAEFSINDSSYGTVFFISTGFHGAHVLIGSIFIIVNIFLINKILLNKKTHKGFEIAAWYWHFVDVVWLFLYISIYWWGK